MDNQEGFVKIAKLLLEKEVIFAEDIELILGPKVKPVDPAPEPEPEAETTVADE